MAAVVVGAVRTCVARRGGSLRGWHSVDLLAFAFGSLMDRVGVSPAVLDQVSASTRSAVGEQALNVARNAVLAAGWSHEIAATSFEGDATCGIAALKNAVSLIDGGAGAVLVGGVEIVSRVPLGASTGIACGKPYGPQLHARYESDGGLVAPHVIAERLATANDIDRAAMDGWVVESRRRADSHSLTGRDKAFVLPVPLRRDRTAQHDPWLSDDQSPDPVTAPESASPVFEHDGLITAANMAQPADGAVALLIASEGFARRADLDVLARLEGVALRGAHPLDGDVGASVGATVCSLDDVEEVFVFEDFAVTPIAMSRVVDRAKINRNGGALARGDTGGAAALSLVGEAAHELAAGNESALVVVAGTQPQTAAVHLIG